MLDVVIIKKKAGPSPTVLPDGLDDLAGHNLMICKSHQESLDGWTIEEMCGHYAIGYLGKIHSQETQLEFLEWMLRYAYHAREDDLGENIDRGLNALDDENARRVAMTIAERLRQEGKVEGIGIGRFELILKQLKKRFGYLSPAIERKLNESGVDVLDRFGESIFDFESLEDAERWWDDLEKGGNA